jgi:hypothetical protein
MTGRSEILQPVEEEAYLGRGERSICVLFLMVYWSFVGYLKVEDDPDRPTYSKEAISLLRISRIGHLKGCD